MLHVLFAVEIVIALAMVGVILLQQSEGGALGMGGGSGGGFGGFLSARGTANLLTRATAILATAFIGVALLLAIVAGNKGDGSSVFDNPSDLETPLTQDQPAGDDLSAPITLDDEGDTLDTPPPTEDDSGDGNQ